MLPSACNMQQQFACISTENCFDGGRHFSSIDHPLRQLTYSVRLKCIVDLCAPVHTLFIVTIVTWNNMHTLLLLLLLLLLLMYVNRKRKYLTYGWIISSSLLNWKHLYSHIVVKRGKWIIKNGLDFIAQRSTVLCIVLVENVIWHVNWMQWNWFVLFWMKMKLWIDSTTINHKQALRL